MGRIISPDKHPLQQRLRYQQVDLFSSSSQWAVIGTLYRNPLYTLTVCVSPVIDPYHPVNAGSPAQDE